MTFNTLEQFIAYRNKMYIRARARTLRFKDSGSNYYWKRLKEINLLYPEYSKLGLIYFKHTDPYLKCFDETSSLTE